jgi:hypothetical protein
MEEMPSSEQPPSTSDDSNNVYIERYPIDGPRRSNVAEDDPIESEDEILPSVVPKSTGDISESEERKPAPVEVPVPSDSAVDENENDIQSKYPINEDTDPVESSEEESDLEEDSGSSGSALPGSEWSEDDPNEGEIYGRRVLPDVEQPTPIANIVPVKKYSKEYFANFIDEDDFMEYVTKRKVPISIFSQGENSPNTIWISLIVIMIILFLLCFIQNCGYLINDKMVLGKMICTGGPTTTLLKKSLIGLALVTCFFSGIYFLINISHKYEEGKAKTLKDMEKAMTDGVIQTTKG